MSWKLAAGLALGISALAMAAPGYVRADDAKKPNIVVIMGDDIGITNIGVYGHGMMAGKTPTLDKIAREGMLFTDYYAEASCTAGRAAFITGQLPIRTGLTTVGQAGAAIGMPAQAVTLASVLKSMGYATGQFGKNHLGDKNEFLPTVHGFDEFFGYLYHLDAMEDPFHPNYPQALLNQVGPRNMLHSWATDVDDPTEMPRWGKIGKQKIVDEGPLPPHPMAGIKYNMETVDEAFVDASIAFMDKAKADNKPFFLWLNPTRMHVVCRFLDAGGSDLSTRTDGRRPESARARSRGQPGRCWAAGAMGISGWRRIRYRRDAGDDVTRIPIRGGGEEAEEASRWG